MDCCCIEQERSPLPPTQRLHSDRAPRQSLNIELKVGYYNFHFNNPRSNTVTLPDDVQSRVRWEDYTKAKEEMFNRTNIPEAPWWIVPANDKKRARLNCIQHLLNRIPYTELPRETIQLPERVFNTDYERHELPDNLYVPQVF